MYNTLYDDENHGIELATLKRSQERAWSLCRKAGIPATRQQVNALRQKELSKLIGGCLDILTEKASWAS